MRGECWSNSALENDNAEALLWDPRCCCTTAHARQTYEISGGPFRWSNTQAFVAMLEVLTSWQRWMQPADPWQLSVLVWIYWSLLHGDNYILAFSRETRCHVIKLIHSLINSNNSPLTIIVVTRQIKMPNILCFQLLKCEDLLFFSVLFQSE